MIHSSRNHDLSEFHYVLFENGHRKTKVWAKDGKLIIQQDIGEATTIHLNASNWMEVDL